MHVPMCAQSLFRRESFITFLAAERRQRFLLRLVRPSVVHQIVIPLELHTTGFALPPALVRVR